MELWIKLGLQNNQRFHVQTWHSVSGLEHNHGLELSSPGLYFYFWLNGKLMLNVFVKLWIKNIKDVVNEIYLYMCMQSIANNILYTDYRVTKNDETVKTTWKILNMMLSR